MLYYGALLHITSILPVGNYNQLLLVQWGQSSACAGHTALSVVSTLVAVRGYVFSWSFPAMLVE